MDPEPQNISPSVPCKKQKAWSPKQKLECSINDSVGHTMWIDFTIKVTKTFFIRQAFVQSAETIISGVCMYRPTRRPHKHSNHLHLPAEQDRDRP